MITSLSFHIIYNINYIGTAVNEVHSPSLYQNVHTFTTISLKNAQLTAQPALHFFCIISKNVLKV